RALGVIHSAAASHVAHQRQDRHADGRRPEPRHLETEGISGPRPRGRVLESDVDDVDGALRPYRLPRHSDAAPLPRVHEPRVLTAPSRGDRNMTSRVLRWCVGAAIVTSALGGAACRNALDVNNPQLIPEGNLTDPQLINGLTNTAIAALQTS